VVLSAKTYARVSFVVRSWAWPASGDPVEALTRQAASELTRERASALSHHRLLICDWSFKRCIEFIALD
jgi:hypothetical protein